MTLFRGWGWRSCFHLDHGPLVSKAEVEMQTFSVHKRFLDSCKLFVNSQSSDKVDSYNFCQFFHSFMWDTLWRPLTLPFSAMSQSLWGFFGAGDPTPPAPGGSMAPSCDWALQLLVQRWGSVSAGKSALGFSKTLVKATLFLPKLLSCWECGSARKEADGTGGAGSHLWGCRPDRSGPWSRAACASTPWGNDSCL